MTTTTNHNIAPPAGARVVDDWQPGPRSLPDECGIEPQPYRMILGARRHISDNCGNEGAVDVWTSVAQFADGTIDHDGWIEPPSIHVDSCNDNGLTVEQALELAVAIIEATAEISRWRKGTGTA
jgi:hypothetical protein